MTTLPKLCATGDQPICLIKKRIIKKNMTFAPSHCSAFAVRYSIESTLDTAFKGGNHGPQSFSLLPLYRLHRYVGLRNRWLRSPVADAPRTHASARLVRRQTSQLRDRAGGCLFPCLLSGFVFALWTALPCSTPRTAPWSSGCSKAPSS